MTREEIESRGAGRGLVWSMGAEPASVGPGFHEESSAGWTSLSHLMLVSELESEFGVTFAGSEVLKAGELGTNRGRAGRPARGWPVREGLRPSRA